ncbi:tyrosine-type recombinase/integrase [Beduini sp.]|uniref:tyrosine-type recombinase/integrase n=1 Tax=Beduini sp. TaxID=1922300 RepID=UPI0039906BDA
MKEGDEVKSVDPIRDKYLLADIEEYLRKKEVKTKHQEFIRDRNHLIFMFGVYEGRRISDFIVLKYGDITDDRIEMLEKKTGKENTLYLHDKVIREVKSYAKKYNLNKSDYLFPSRKRDPITKLRKPLARNGAYAFLKKDIQDYFGTQTGNIGTHTLRKTFGYMYYQATHDVVMLQKLFNHATPTITLDYIGITKDQKREAIQGFDPFK